MTIDQRIHAVFTRSVCETCDWQTWQSMQSLKEYASLDSMAVLEFLAGLEKEFELRFPEEDLELSLFTERHRLIEYLSEAMRDA